MPKSFRVLKRSKKAAPKYPTYEHPPGSGIKIAEMPNRTGGNTFGVSYQVRIPGALLGTPNGRELLQRRTKAEAERLAEDRLLALRQHGTQFASIPADAQRQAAMAWGILSQHNEGSGIALNLLEVVKAGIRSLSPAGGRKTLADVFAELRASKAERHRAGGLDETTNHDFKIRTARIETDLGARFVSEVTHTEIAVWLARMRKDGAQFGGPLSLRSVRNYRNTLAEGFKFAKARQYCSENPFDRFTREDLRRLGGENAERNLDEINILTTEETRRLLDAAHQSNEAGMLPSVVLRLFCGLRTAEVCRLDWSEVFWLDAKPFVHIPAGKAKKRRIRHVDIPENALEWLRLCNPPKAGRIVPCSGKPTNDAKAYCQRFRRISKAAGIGKETADGDWQSEWESNDTRHSYGSYHFALHGDALKTAAQMGHKQNDDVLFAHYRSLVRTEQAKDFFGIVPALEASKLTAFPRAATA
jgi:integrase